MVSGNIETTNTRLGTTEKSQFMAKILLVEDNIDLATNVEDMLKFEKHVVDLVHTAEDACLNLKTWTYDAIVLDLTLPDASGYEVLQQYRTTGGQAPVLILTGRNTIIDKTIGFEGGCDDYLTKPFHMKELLVRLVALMRRPRRLAPTILKVGPITFDCSSLKVDKNGAPVSLTPLEFQFFEFLMKHPNQAFTSEILFKRIWPSDSSATNEAIKTVVKNLRKKLDPEGQYLQTIHGSGYILRVEQKREINVE